GANSTVGGLAAASAGVITASTASGAVSSSGANSTVGGLAGANSGTITNSTGTGVVTSTGPNSIVTDPTNAPPPPVPPEAPTPTPTPPTPLTPVLPQQLPTFSPEFLASLPGPVQVINNLVGNGPTQLA